MEQGHNSVTYSQHKKLIGHVRYCSSKGVLAEYTFTVDTYKRHMRQLIRVNCTHSGFHSKLRSSNGFALKHTHSISTNTEHRGILRTRIYQGISSEIGVLTGPTVGGYQDAKT